MSFAEPLPALDALFLYLESPRTPMHVGSVALFEGGPFKDSDGHMRTDAIRAQMESRLHLVPKLRRRVRFSPFGVAGPVWVDDVDFDIARHVRRATLARPGTEAQLLEFTADLLALPLDRRHPLWELWFVDGLAGGRVALIEKLHHAVADGLASVELATVLLDFERDPAPRPAPAPPWRPHRAPFPVTVVARDLVRRGTHPLRTGVRRVAAVRHPWRSVRQTTELAGALGTLTTVRSVAPRSSINVKVGPRRRLAFVRQPLEPLREAERRFGVTINDLVLTAVAGGLAALVGGRGELGDETTVQALVPVGTDAHGDHRLGNKVSALVVRLPLGTGDAVARLGDVSQVVARCKKRHQALAGDFIIRAIEAWPRSALAPVAGLIHHQPFVNLVVTNVPGPPVPLYAMGARMLEVFPVIPLAGNLSVGVAAFSYDGQLSLGIFADGDSCPDLDVLADGIRTSFAELVATAGESGAAVGVATTGPSPGSRRGAAPVGKAPGPRAPRRSVGNGAGTGVPVRTGSRPRTDKGHGAGGRPRDRASGGPTKAGAGKGGGGP